MKLPIVWHVGVLLDEKTWVATVTEDEEQPKPMKSVFTLAPCRCGADIGYVSIGHIPCAWEEDDEALPMFATQGTVVDAPEGAQLWRELRRQPSCANKVYRA